MASKGRELSAAEAKLLDLIGIAYCQSCLFYKSLHADSAGGFGQCRRYPPVAPAAGEDRLAVWPQVEDIDWCGEHSSIARPVEGGP